MKKKVIQLTTTGLTTLLLLSTTAPSIIYADSFNTNSDNTTEINENSSLGYYLSSLNDEQKAKVEMMTNLGNDLSLLENGQLALAVDTETLKINHNLTDDDIAFIESAIANYNACLTSTPSYNSSYSWLYESKAKFDGAYIYLTYDEVMWIVNQAASFGPGVIAGLMASLLSFYPGIGTIVGGIVGFLGAASILGAMQAAASKHRGIKIGVGGISNW